MIRAIRLEWLKQKPYRLFWILLGMYFLALLVLATGGGFFLEWLKNRGLEFNGIDPTIVPIYDFPDIWQNLTYLASFGIILLAFIVVVSVSNDLMYNTLRQNIIDGSSKWEYIGSKIALIVFLAAFSTIVVFIAGLIQGWIYSPVHTWEDISGGFQFLVAYFLQIVLLCLLAMLFTLIIKRPGFIIIALLLYTMMFEPILTAIFENAPFFDGGFFEGMAAYFPVHSINKLIANPFGRYIFQEITDYVPVKALLVAFSWLVIYLGLSVLILKQRDLKA